MDDNKLLTLANEERIRLQDYCSLLFEVGDLKYASAATVSRCGMIYVDPENLANIIVQLTKLLDSLFLPLINPEKKDQLELNSDKIHAIFLQAFILSFDVCLKQEKWNDLIPKYEHDRSKRSTELLVLTIDTIRL
ncbi:unnamed protein product, partial [Rotaria sp. Silwood2]